MSKEKIYIFDTTLRDGAQTQGVDFSLNEKEKIAKSLDNLGVDYIEGGWPTTLYIINSQVIQRFSDFFFFI